eukprot:CAMPEP_0171186284 /NCGR_PEP_ID=MMETSP0790-20130122/16732_1 /TAXON_ID=2925 /ORGANISM="Alexandrium catenella, Strain OF101" /LENGTH=291 /DNA_ID=CAMNT_0011651321 /DNA_START=183 /DNA_END=1059 /DNA_ORIENTATION=+
MHSEPQHFHALADAVHVQALDEDLGRRQAVDARGTGHWDLLLSRHVLHVVALVDVKKALVDQVAEGRVLARALLELVAPVALLVPHIHLSVVEDLGRGICEAQRHWRQVGDGVAAEGHAEHSGVLEALPERFNPGVIAGSRAAEDDAPLYVVAEITEVEHRELRCCTPQGVPGYDDLGAWVTTDVAEVSVDVLPDRAIRGKPAGTNVTRLVIVGAVDALEGRVYVQGGSDVLEPLRPIRRAPEDHHAAVFQPGDVGVSLGPIGADIHLPHGVDTRDVVASWATPPSLKRGL